jgi:hypothetical protein
MKTGSYLIRSGIALLVAASVALIVYGYWLGAQAFQ